MKLLLFLIPLVILISGCTIPGTNIFIPIPGFNIISQGNDIIVIQSLRTIPSTITAPQQTRLIATIQNRGDREFPIDITGTGADNIKNQKLTVELFDFCEGLFTENPKENEKAITVTCPGVDEPVDGRICILGNLLPGELKEISWFLTPTEDTALITPCDLKVSVTYPYATSGLTTIHFINSEEYDRQLNQNTFRSRSSTISLGEGPVKAWFEVKDDQPIPAVKSQPATIPVNLHIENQGSGFVKILKTGEIDGGVYITKHSLLNFGGVCKSNLGLTNAEKLIQDERIVPCTIKQRVDCTDQSQDNVNSLQNKCVAKETTQQLTVDIAYIYEFRDEVRVTVEPAFE